jgi:hypothetical protein
MNKFKELGSFIMCRIDKALRSRRQLLWLTGFTAIVFGLLYLPASFTGTLSVTDSIFAFINPGSTFHPGFPDSDKHWALFIGFAGMILLGGLLISVFNNIMQRRVEKVNDGRVYYRFKKHTLIVGYNKMCINLINQLAEKHGTRLNIVLQTTCDVPAVRHELFSYLDRAIESQITIVLGSRTSVEDVEKLYPAEAEEIFILGETGEYDHDALNIECMAIMAGLMPFDEKCQKKCHVLIEYQSTYAIFQRKSPDEITKQRIDFLPFNFHETWAKKVFVDGEYKSPAMPNPIRYTPLDRKPVRFDSEETVHLLIVGMSQMGVALGIQASHICHFPNFIRDKRKKTRITFIDANADREMNFLQGRYPALFDEIDWSFADIETPENRSGNCNSKEKFTDIEWHFVKGQVEHPLVRQQIREWSNEPDVYFTIAVCIEHPPASMAAGLYLPEEVYAKRIPVLALQQNSHVTLSLLEKDFKYGEVRAFGMLDNCFNLQESEDRLPMLVNYVYDEFYNTDKVPSLERLTEEEENDVRQRWAKLKTVKKWSNRYNANMLKVKRRSFDIDRLTELPEKDYREQIEWLSEVEHNRWNIEELLMGYRPGSPEEHAEIEDDINKYYRLKAAEGEKSDTVKNWKAKLGTYKNVFVHDFICPYENLGKDEQRSAKEYDRAISIALPHLLKYLK